MAARICGVGTATHGTSYSQSELLDRFCVADPRVRSLFLKSSIDRRHLVLPRLAQDGSSLSETQGQLLAKHRKYAVQLGREAIKSCLEAVGAAMADISYLGCTTTTGFLSPGLSALLCDELGLPETCARLDVVGMGCNAGLNALNAATNWALANQGKLAIMLCVEICSAGYVFDNTMRTAVVNSLFGDGAAAIALRAGEPISNSPNPTICKFSSLLIKDTRDSMRFDWDDVQHKFSFFLDPDIPYVIGANVERAIDKLLSSTAVSKRGVNHWLFHSGGKKVIDAVRVNLGLSRHALRHTTEILRNYGNLSSGSFLFSYQRLLNESIVATGDYGVMVAMGPGATIESALIQW